MALTFKDAIISLISGLFFNCFALCANLRVDKVSLKSSLWGLMQAKRVKYEFGFNEPKSKWLNYLFYWKIKNVPWRTEDKTLSRYGISLFPIDMACSTLLIARSPWLIFTPSDIAIPLWPVRRTPSDPAKSTIFIQAEIDLCWGSINEPLLMVTK